MLKKNKLPYAAFLLFAAVFVILTYKGLGVAQPGDENDYFYMGKLIAEGKMPYKDFFYAHPPLHIYIIALVYRIFGFNITALKLIPLISALISSFFIFKLTKEKFGNLESVIASLLFMSSYSIMFNSVFSLGIMTATMFLVIGFYFLFAENNYYTSGLFLGLASITRLLALVPIFTALAIIFFYDRKNLAKLLLPFLGIFLALNLIFIFLYGGSYIDPIYKFHLLKKTGSGENLREYFDAVKYNWVIFLSAAAFVFAKGKKPLAPFLVTSAIYLIFLLTLKKFFGFYFVIAFPFLAVIGGYTLANILTQTKINNKFKMAIGGVFMLLFLWNLAADASFLQKKGLTGFERGNDLVNFVNSNSNQDTLLFGDASVTPLLALLTDKKIAFDFVDTNDQVFSSKAVDINQALSSLKGNDILFIARDKGLSSLKEVRNFLNKNCDFLGSINDKTEGNYIFYRCRQFK
ncbi:glycosyltransferase family 39 protein [Candidatus Woesearchaeota archaeon]|nr:glycosyltransferase family 39 protein [Candidatus Woesearchaeota archaeon]